MRLLGRVLLCCGPLGVALSCHAADGAPVGPPPQGKEIMIYFRQAIGGHHPVRVYGLRLEQASLPPTSPAAPVSSLIRHRELVSVEFAPHADMRLQFGRRLIWDIGRHEFGVGTIQPYSPFRLWTEASLASCSSQLSCLKPLAH
ncbi:MAG: hypothetical protein JOZ12_14465 [Sinobacteraceae bacterium]|nr:hypothetical protein [Nevskiaceae bacterium]